MERTTVLSVPQTGDRGEPAGFRKTNITLALSIASFAFSVVALLMGIAALVDVQVR
jgi:hypothetical protein